MYLIITQDRFLFYSISCILGPDMTEHIRCVEDICLQRHRHAHVILDIFKNNVIYTPLAERIALIEPERMYIMSPFGIKKCFTGMKVRFIPRAIQVQDLRELVVHGRFYEWQPKIYLTRRQHHIITMTLLHKSQRVITDDLNISIKTLFSHKYNIMLLLNLKKFSGLLSHPFSLYLRYEQHDMHGMAE